MKPLSESLMDLAARVKQVEDSSGAVREKNRTALQDRHRELEASIERESGEFEKITTDMREAAQRWWSEARDSLQRQMTAMRTDFDAWQTETEKQKQEQAARAAEEDAVTAVALASYFLDTAEWAVVRAGLLASARVRGEQSDTEPTEKA